MSPCVAIVLASCLAMQASGLRVPHPDQAVITGTAADFKDAARSLMAKASRAHNCTKINPGTPLPEGRFNWEIEDFNPEALKMSPCGQDGKSGIFDEAGDETGEQGLTVPEGQLLEAVKLFIGELTKDENDVEKACKKMDKDGKDEISEREFKDWVEAQPLDQRVKDGKVLDAIYDMFKDDEKEAITVEGCKKHLEKQEKKSAPKQGR